MMKDTLLKLNKNKMGNQNKSIFVAIASIFLVLGSLWVVWKMTADPSADQKKEVAMEIKVTPDDTIKGDIQAPITLVEYSDFQCPSCKVYSSTVKSVVESNPDVRFVYRHFPLDQHEHARLAAAAAESAGKQKKFFEYHDMLFENQDAWAANKDAEKMFVEYAQKLNLNVDTFKKDLKSKEIQNSVEADYKSGIGFGVNETPSFFLDGVRIKPNSAAQFQTLIESARKKLSTSEDSTASATLTGEPIPTKAQ